MASQTLIQFCKYCILLCLLFFANTNTSYAQDTNHDFKNSLETAISNEYKNYSDIDSIFKHFKRDSLKMQRLIKESKTNNYLEGESYAYNALGAIYRNKSFYDKAIELHKKADSLAILSNNVNLKVSSLNMLGVVYRRMDLVSSALDYHSQALTLANSVENKDAALKYSIAVSQNSMGNIYLVLKQYDLALKQFNESIKIEKEANNKLGLAINHQNIGFAKEAKGLLEEALVDYQKSLTYNNAINSEVGKVICFNSIGKVFIKQKKYEEAKNIIEKALEKALIIKDQIYITSSYLNLGWLNLEINNLQQAKLNLTKALEIAQEYKFKSSKIEAYRHLSDLSIKNNNYKDALNNTKIADSIENTINNQRNLNYINDLLIKYESDAKNNTIEALASENEEVKSQLQRNQLALLVGLLVLILFFIILIVFNRHNQVKQDKKILTLEQDMLRIQMNPHFIFNSLNSIKLYIINNEKENAVYYLNKFAKLIRKILVASNEKNISLSDELDTMELYMNIENIRFSNEIDFSINIDENVNVDNIKVPSLVLQPFLENALWHGLSTKKNDKKITLDIEKMDNRFVTISITDNGVGREASEKIKQQKTLKRKSIGIAITRERLFNFSRQYHDMYNMHIEDLKDENGSALGTKVVVNIPIQFI
jgi:LytS/YehU family sensor histidine kinase